MHHFWRVIQQSFSGALRPLGTINFADLPSTADASSGDMYNIANQFTTTTDFKEGAGNIIPAGSNVYLTVDRYWDVLAGTPVTGVKGNAEKKYRRGNVNITPANIGALATTGNASNTTVTFTEPSTRANLVSGEKVSVGFGKIKKWFADLKSFAFKELVNNLTTTTTGSALDASQGKILNEKYEELNQSLADIRTWKVLVNSVPSATVTEWNLPTTDWKELEIRIGYSNDNNYCALRVVKAEIPSTGTQFRRSGYYYDAENRMYVGIGFTKTKIGVSDFNYIAGGTSKNEFSTSIYYR